jgi:serine O-acetyltransferase
MLSLTRGRSCSPDGPAHVAALGPLLSLGLYIAAPLHLHGSTTSALCEPHRPHTPPAGHIGPDGDSKMTAGQLLRTEPSAQPQRVRHSTPPAALQADIVPSYPPPESDGDESWVWSQIKAEARRDADAEPALASFLYATVLSHASLDRSLAFHLANKLCSSTLLSTLLYDLFVASLAEHPSVRAAAVADLIAARSRDPACAGFAHCLLNYKGFLAVQAHRVAHVLWAQGRRALALALQSRVAEVFAVDIHPAATVGRGILLDHATGVVVGETAVVGDNVSILHHVTLGGTGKAVGDRHPKIGDGVLIGAGATVLGNVRIGAGAKVGAGSVVLIDVPPRSTAVGNPARLIGGKKGEEVMPGESMDHTSFIQQWSDYII